MVSTRWELAPRNGRMDDVPRIAATLASLLLIVGSIGVNIARYPVVWQTVNGLDGTGPAADLGSAPASVEHPPAPPAAAASQPAVAAKPAPPAPPPAPPKKDAKPAPPASPPAAAKPIPPPKPAPPAIAKAVPPAATVVPEKKPEVASSSASPAKPPPATTAPAQGDSPKSSPAAVAKPSNDSDRSEPIGHILGVRPLVPVVFSGASAPSEGEVRRLPPVDHVAAPPSAGSSLAASPDNLSTSYPTTGVP